MDSVIKSFIIMGLCAACGFICTVLIQNRLPIEEAGRFILVLTLIQAVALLAPLGYEKLFRRFFANFDVASFAWRRQVRVILVRGLGLIAVAILWARFQYDLEWVELTVIVLAATAFMISLLLGSIFQSLERFGLSALAVGGHRIVLLFFLSILLVAFGSKSYLFCEVALAGAFAVMALFCLSLGLSLAPEGDRQIPREYHRESLYFLGTALCLMVYTYTDRMVIPAVLGEEQLARYFAVYNPFLVFDLAAMALGSVLIIKVARTHVSAPALTLGLFFLAFLGYALFLPAVEPILHLLYGGRYDDMKYLAPIIGLTKSLNLILVVPTSMLGGRLGRKALGLFAKTNLGFTPINIALVWWLASAFSLTGVALGMLAISLQWNIVGFACMALYSRTRVATLAGERNEP